MNERLLELYKQSRVRDTFTDPSNNMLYETTSFSADLFAELIVKECMLVGRKAQIDNRLVDAEIKDHFGVES